MRIALFSPNFSARMGGEAGKGFYFFDRMRRRGHRLDVVTHARVRDELEERFADDPESLACFHFVEDSPLQANAWRVMKRFPQRLRDASTQAIINVSTMQRARTVVAGLVRDGAELVWQPVPISPKALCLLEDLGAPLVIGPMCGGLEFPPGFRFMNPPHVRATVTAGRAAAAVLHRVFPGKRRADALIVANDRTRRALPGPVRGRVYVDIPESGVDLAAWKPVEGERAPGPVRFVYAGRFDDLKGVQYLAQAFANVAGRIDARLELVGDGDMRAEIEAVVARGGIEDRVVFHGWRPKPEARKIVRAADVFAMPSLRECGGNALLEAMASGLPIITTNWAGPGQYVSEACGFRVEPTSPDGLVAGLEDAIVQLAESPELRRRMGEAGIARVRTHAFDWESKTDRLLEIFEETRARWTGTPPAA